MCFAMPHFSAPPPPEYDETHGLSTRPSPSPPWQPPPPLSWHHRHPTLTAALASAVLFLVVYIIGQLP